MTGAGGARLNNTTEWARTGARTNSGQIENEQYFHLFHLARPVRAGHLGLNCARLAKQVALIARPKFNSIQFATLATIVAQGTRLIVRAHELGARHWPPLELEHMDGARLAHRNEPDAAKTKTNRRPQPPPSSIFP